MGLGNNNPNNNNNKNKNNNKKNKTLAIIEFILMSVVCGAVIFMFFQTFFGPTPVEEVSYVEFMKAVEDEQVKAIDYDRSVSYIYFYQLIPDDEIEESLDQSLGDIVDDETMSELESIQWVRRYKTSNPTYTEFKKEMLEKDIYVNETKLESNFMSNIGDMIFQIALYGSFLGLMMFGMSRMQKGEEITIDTESTKKFSDVAGLEEVKESSLTIVDMLKNPAKYRAVGARISKGVILYGPPGTGKTLLAKAIAGEAGVNFLACSAADFENKYVGVGANHVRELFKQAKAKAPCILFIDEIDAVGCRRGANDKSFERQTINALLSCMDGFATEDGITVFAATNDIESLDPALLRPGRFDSRFAVGLPDTSEDRKAIAKLYLKNKRLADDVDLDALAKETLGCSPADIEVIINEAAIESVKNGGVITREQLDNAFYKHIMHGHKKKSSDRDEADVRTTAWHEAGHALIGWLLGEEITKISIVPTTSGAGGVTIFNQKKLGMYSKQELENKIKMLYAGRNAELLLNGESGITNGASQDIKEATKIITNMVSSFGMSSFGLLDLNGLNVSNESLLKECKAISQEMNRDSYELLRQNQDMLEALASTLIKEETIDDKRMQEILGGFVND